MVSILQQFSLLLFDDAFRLFTPATLTIAESVYLLLRLLASTYNTLTHTPGGQDRRIYITSDVWTTTLHCTWPPPEMVFRIIAFGFSHSQTATLFPLPTIADNRHRFCRQWRDCLIHDTTDKGALEGHTDTDWPCISRPNWTLLENYSETAKEEEDLIARPTLLSLLQGPGCLLSAALLRTNEWQLWHGCQDVIARVCSLSRYLSSLVSVVPSVSQEQSRVESDNNNNKPVCFSTQSCSRIRSPPHGNTTGRHAGHTDELLLPTTTVYLMPVLPLRAYLEILIIVLLLSTHPLSTTLTRPFPDWMRANCCDDGGMLSVIRNSVSAGA